MLLNYHTLAVLFLDCCVLELGCGSAGVVTGLPAEAQQQTKNEISQCGSSTA